jgi:hypothetical protein
MSIAQRSRWKRRLEKLRTLGERGAGGEKLDIGRQCSGDKFDTYRCRIELDGVGCVLFLDWKLKSATDAHLGQTLDFSLEKCF